MDKFKIVIVGDIADENQVNIKAGVEGKELNDVITLHKRIEKSVIHNKEQAVNVHNILHYIASSIDFVIAFNSDDLKEMVACINRSTI